MVKIQQLKKPNPKSGELLKPGKTFKKRGLTITNSNNVANVYVKEWKRKKDKTRKKRKAVVARRKK